MNRIEFENYIFNAYKTGGEFPWLRYPSFSVYRHKSNNKWFAVVMDVPKQKLGISSNENVSIVNLKCDVNERDKLLKIKGIFPAYHMNKYHWISVVLDGSIKNDTIIKLLETSYNATRLI